jgi:hypothetical protein
VTDQGVHALSALTSLGSLDLSYCKLVTVQCVHALTSLTSLKSLNLMCCGSTIYPVTYQDLQDLRVSMSLKVEYGTLYRIGLVLVTDQGVYTIRVPMSLKLKYGDRYTRYSSYSVDYNYN